MDKAGCRVACTRLKTFVTSLVEQQSVLLLSYDQNLYLCVLVLLLKMLSVCRSKTTKNAHVHYHSNSFITNKVCVFSSSFTHLLIHSFIHFFIHSFIHSSIHSFNSLCADSVHLEKVIAFFLLGEHPQSEQMIINSQTHRSSSCQFHVFLQR